MWLKQNNDVPVSAFDCSLYYNFGSTTRACLAALQASLQLDLQATGMTVTKRRYQHEIESTNITRLTYEEWIRVLWSNLPDCKKQDTSSKMVEDENGHEYVVFRNFEEFERDVRHAMIPANQYSISHLVLQTAWEGENILSPDGTWKQSDLQNALQLDSYYATMVRGACVKVPLTPDIWCAHDEMQHTGEDTALFFTIMWQGLEQVAKQWHSNILSWTTRLGNRNNLASVGTANNAASDGLETILQSSEVVNTTRRVKDIKRVMKEIWEESKSYRISDTVRMTEMQVLARLCRDGLLPHFQDTEFLLGKNMDPLHICFLFRRHEILRNQFAATIGRRMMTERAVSSSSKSNIMDHHRTVQWSENEYIALAQLVQNNLSIIDSLIQGYNHAKPGHYFLDYVKMLTVNPQYQAAQNAGYNMYADV